MTVKGIEVAYKRINADDYISLTDIAKLRTDAPDIVIQTWMRTHNTIAYLGTWEVLHNPNFNPHIFEGFKVESAENAFWMSPKKWIENTGAIGIISKAGRYGGGTYAHKDIAFKFASWLSVEFELYLVQEFQRLKAIEQIALEWTAKREFAKINYRIQTDAIKENLIVPTLTQRQISYVYANEADMLNVALFGKTAAEWKIENPDLKGNMRDYSSVEQLLVLANLESYNAILIEQGLPQSERITLLNKTAQRQVETLMATRIDSDKLFALPKGKK